MGYITQKMVIKAYKRRQVQKAIGDDLIPAIGQLISQLAGQMRQGADNREPASTVYNKAVLYGASKQIRTLMAQVQNLPEDRRYMKHRDIRGGLQTANQKLIAVIQYAGDEQMSARSVSYYLKEVIDSLRGTIRSIHSYQEIMREAGHRN